jgi:hypothetical protein
LNEACKTSNPITNYLNKLMYLELDFNVLKA